MSTPVKKPSLHLVKHFMYQLSGIQEEGAIEKLAASRYDLVVVPTVSTIKGNESFDTQGMVAKLQKSRASSFRRKLVFSYLSVGEAESYRSYWKDDWRVPSKGGCERGDPSFLVAEDPAMWGRSHAVLYWDARWKETLKTSLKGIIDAGFSGVVMDWVDMYDDPCVKEMAEKSGVDPMLEMANLVSELRNYARSLDPNFKLIANNGIMLGCKVPKYLKSIDGIIIEGAFYTGVAGSGWNEEACCDVKADETRTEMAIEGAKTYLKAKIPVFSIDYALKNAATAYKRVPKGWKPLVTRNPLSGMTTTPPPKYPRFK